MVPDLTPLLRVDDSPTEFQVFQVGERRRQALAPIAWRIIIFFDPTIAPQPVREKIKGFVESIRNEFRSRRR